MSERIPLIVGNWKMHFTIEEALRLAERLVKNIKTNSPEVAVAPPFTALYAVGKALKGSPIRLSAQDVYFEKKGPFTGEVSSVMLKDLGCAYCIVGHSERRQYFNEKDDFIAKKAKALLLEGIIPIVCVGETLKEREAGKTFEIVSTQVKGSLAGIEPAEMEKVVIAYEPVWAIGTGVVAKDSQAQEVHGFIRGLLEEIYNKGIAKIVRILYGGSVKPENISGLMSQKDIDGGLVGGASLKAEEFLEIIDFKV